MSESQKVEWKAWLEYLWVCGPCELGQGATARTKGEVVGVKNILRLLENTQQGPSYSALSLTSPEVRSGREYLEIVVAPHPNPISYKGEFH